MITRIILYCHTVGMFITAVAIFHLFVDVYSQQQVITLDFGGADEHLQ